MPEVIRMGGATLVRDVELRPDRWDRMRERLKTRVAVGDLKRATVAKMLLSVMDDLEKAESTEA